MLAPRASNAYVCIRCKLQHARRRLPSYTRSRPHASFSTTARRLDGIEELEAQSTQSSSGPTITREVSPLDRIRRRRGKYIKETSTALGGVKRLGKDANILVLRELGDARHEGPVEIPEVNEKPRAVPNITASLQEDGELSPEEVRDRLKSLRPQALFETDEPHYVTQRTFMKLGKNISTGFTMQQLSRFYSEAQNIEQKNVPRKILEDFHKKADTAELPAVCTQWQPGITTIARRLPGPGNPFPGRNRKSKSGLNKQTLVDRILRDVWELVPQEEAEALGELEILLKPWQLTLLTAGGEQSALEKVGRARKVKLELYQAEYVLRITADKTTAEYAAQDVQDILAKVTTNKLRLKPWLPFLKQTRVSENTDPVKLYKQDDFDVVCSQTGTTIQRMDNKDTLVIRGLNPKSVFDAKRMLINLLPHDDHVHHTLSVHGMKREESYKMIPMSIDDKSIAHQHRNIALGRWSYPVVRDSPSQDLERPDQSTSVENTSDNPVERILESLEKIKFEATVKAKSRSNAAHIPPFWKPEPGFKLAAKFGQALFPFDPATSIDNNANNHVHNLIYTPALPGLSSLIGHPDFEAQSENQTPTLVYDFLPAPGQTDNVAGASLPTLSIRMSRLNESFGIKRVTLALQQHKHYVLFPGKASDVCFSVSEVLSMVRPRANNLLKDWIQQVREIIKSGNRLWAPQLDIELPDYLYPGVGGAKPKSFTVSYLFSGVRVQNNFNGTVDGINTSYTTTQSSIIGATGGSLRMHFPDTLDPAHFLQDKLQVTDFLRKSLAMTDRITTCAAQRQPVTKFLPRRSESRQMRRSVDNETTVATEAATEGTSPLVEPSEPATATDLKTE